MRLIKLNNQRGDTIVEVLIAIAVMAAVLGSAYAITNRNSRSYQQVGEHTEAVKLAETQLERIRSVAGIGGQDKINMFAAGDFCLDFNDTGANGGKGTYTLTSGSCQVDRYTVTVRHSSSGNIFESEVTWPGIQGGTDRVSLFYGVYQ